MCTADLFKSCFLYDIPRFIKKVLILDPSFKDAFLMQPKNKQKSHRHACESVANAKEHKEKTKAENEAEWSCDQDRQQMIGCIAER